MSARESANRNLVGAGLRPTPTWHAGSGPGSHSRRNTERPDTKQRARQTEETDAGQAATEPVGHRLHLRRLHGLVAADERRHAVAISASKGCIHFAIVSRYIIISHYLELFIPDRMAHHSRRGIGIRPPSAGHPAPQPRIPASATARNSARERPGGPACALRCQNRCGVFRQPAATPGSRRRPAKRGPSDSPLSEPFRRLSFAHDSAFLRLCSAPGADVKFQRIPYISGSLPCRY